MHKLVGSSSKFVVRYVSGRLFPCVKLVHLTVINIVKAAHNSFIYTQVNIFVSRMSITSGFVRTLCKSKAQLFTQALSHINSGVLKVIPIIPRTNNKHYKGE